MLAASRILDAAAAAPLAAMSLETFWREDFSNRPDFWKRHGLVSAKS
jgi:hypothetical protein